MEQADEKCNFALTARADGWPSKLYTPITVMNLEKVIVADAHAMWDTGAEICIISKALADALMLDYVPGPKARGLTGEAGTSLCYAYVALVAGGGIVTVKCAVVDDHIGGMDYSVILGLDFIRRGSLAITGGNGAIALSFAMPPAMVVDFTSAVRDKPISTIPLSPGREHIRIYSGIEALRLMKASIPPDVLQSQ